MNRTDLDAAPLSPPVSSASTSQQYNEEKVLEDTLVSPEANIAHQPNFGSEADSDESDDDEEILDPFLLREHENVEEHSNARTLETPFEMDFKDAFASQPVAGNPVLANDPTKVPPPPTEQPRNWCDFECKDNLFEDTSVSPDAKIAHPPNYGSEAGSDESEDDEERRYPLLLREHRNVLETPTDVDFMDAVASQPVAGDSATAGNPATPGNPAHASDPTPTIDTAQPHSWCDFEWKAFPHTPIPPEWRRETFSKINVGPTTPRVDPYDIFVEIWDRKIMEHIASETNKYARLIDKQTLCPNSIDPWYDTTVDELYVYFAVILMMGIEDMSREAKFWNPEPDGLEAPGFSDCMSCNRFNLLSRCLHFNDNNDLSSLNLDRYEAQIFKLQPLLTHLNMKFESMYTPAQNIALDESLLMWRACPSIRQILSSKPENEGIKSHELCDCKTGYLWRFELHGPQKTPVQQVEDPLDAFIPSIVLRLTQGLEHKGYTLWMDSFYNSPCLARRLKCLGFDCVGTLRTNREFVPQVLHDLDTPDMRPGQITGLTSGDVDVMVWRFYDRVAMISTYHGKNQAKRGGSFVPSLILDYNNMSEGMDKRDKLLLMYPLYRKHTKVWYKIVFKRLLFISVFNSYIIHKNTSSLRHKDFCMTLVDALLDKHLFE